jgi:hypothetical protein
MTNRHVVILITGVLLLLPSLWVGFVLDDYFCLAAIEGRIPDRDTDRRLFPFFVNDEEATARIAADGGYPWWIDEGVKSRILRPLSDLLIRLDYSLRGRSAFGYHLHSLLWWTATLLACGLVLRRALPGVIGTLAFLLFAIDEVHVLPVAWIANRNALVALAPMLFGLWAWIRWREDGWRAGRFLAPVGIVIGMMGGELALAALAYFVAYELFGAPTSGIRSRLLRLAPIIGLGIAYVAVYRAFGYGSTGSGILLDPVQNPAGFVAAAVTRVPTLLASGIAGFSADLWFAVPSVRTAQVIVGYVAVLCLLGLIRCCWPGLDDSVKRGLRWMLAGSALSLIPVVAVFPSDRMLLVPGIGLAAGVATVMAYALWSWRTHRHWLLIGAGGIFAVVHLLLAPILTVGIQTVLVKQSRQSLELAASPVVRDSRDTETILIFAPDHVVGLYLPLLTDYLEIPAPKSWRPLSIAPCDHRLRRTGPRTLELEVAEGGVMLRSVFEELYRSPENRLLPGAVVDRGLLRAEILESSDRGPTRVAFHFDRDLTDQTLRFLVWLDGELRPAVLPDVGEEIFIERTLGPAGF